MKLVPLDTSKPTAQRIKEALSILDALREQVISGQIAAFVGVSIEPDDVTCGWSFTTRSVSKLRVMGAVASLEHAVHTDEAF